MGSHQRVEGTRLRQWLSKIRSKDTTAVLNLHRHFWGDLIEICAKLRRAKKLHHIDSEDIAAVAFDRFYRAIAGKKYRDLRTYHDLHALSRTVATFTAKDIRREKLPIASLESDFSLSQLPAANNSHQFQDEEIDHLLRSLNPRSREKVREIVKLRMQGHEFADICSILDQSHSKLFRLLRRAREDLKNAHQRHPGD